MALSGLGLVDTVAGDYERAERSSRRPATLPPRGRPWGLTSALWNTADLAIIRGEFDEASRALEEALAVLGETSRERWIAHTLAHLAEVLFARASPSGREDAAARGARALRARGRRVGARRGRERAA